MASTDIARGLAWFGIALGLAEAAMPRRVAQAAGVEGHEDLIRAFGVREIASGALMLSARDPRDWLWTRVVGDALDGILLSSRLGNSNPHRSRTAIAALAVASVVALDAIHAEWP